VEIFGSKVPIPILGTIFIILTNPKLSFLQGCRFSGLGVEDTGEADRPILQGSSLLIQVLQSLPAVVNS